MIVKIWRKDESGNPLEFQIEHERLEIEHFIIAQEAQYVNISKPLGALSLEDVSKAFLNKIVNVELWDGTTKLKSVEGKLTRYSFILKNGLGLVSEPKEAIQINIT